MVSIRARDFNKRQVYVYESSGRANLLLLLRSSFGVYGARAEVLREYGLYASLFSLQFFSFPSVLSFVPWPLVSFRPYLRCLAAGDSKISASPVHSQACRGRRVSGLLPTSQSQPNTWLLSHMPTAAVVPSRRV